MAFSFLRWACIGAAAMYLYDPQNGRGRRARLKDQLDARLRECADFVDRGVRDLENRVRGVGAELRAIGGPDFAPDETIEARVRSVLGRYTSHPHAIETVVEEGRVTLRGPILAREAPRLVSAVASVRGVHALEDALERHDQSDVSSLQGGVPRSGPSVDALQDNWAPGTRLLASALGLWLVLGGLVRRNPSTILSGAFGAGLLVRAVRNEPTFGPTSSHQQY